MDNNFKNVSLEYMINNLVDEIINGLESETFYWYHEDTGFHEIVECDLIRGRFVTDDGDFSEFEWEKKDSSIYIKESVTEMAIYRNFMDSRGYGAVDFDGTGLLEIQKNDHMSVFESDDEAVEQAIRDGIKIIPVDELPENFDRRYLGWIDTPKNRKAIKEYCSEDNYYCNGYSL